ncbi:hypothetical protein BWI93_19220 [Siphonobacter sp. BAB-5385]|uniref:hypothetical protein n=1 Tax=Siphonobacter sp. BAB-5385 TaxID=1864822 RepID=UPI000B9EC8BD|nr:hypothetical protein [Siphonobacter sp. BAB-5385]OZI06612.1 hypothetical protein BWI93_19220 [Siphonobacter sp. BAB-5385]
MNFHVQITFLSPIDVEKDGAAFTAAIQKAGLVFTGDILHRIIEGSIQGPVDARGKVLLAVRDAGLSPKLKLLAVTDESPEHNLEYQWKLYLGRAGVKEEDLHPAQLQQTKQAFFGAMGQMLALQRDYLAELPEMQAVDTLENMWKQVESFWSVQ